jgi:site-specific recombinase XerD
MMLRAQQDAASGLYRIVEESDTGLSEEANAFLRAVATRGLSPRTVRAYAFDIVALYRWMLATDRSLVGLTQADMLDFVRWERERGAHPSSINRRLTTCRLLHGFRYPQEPRSTAGTSLPAPYYRGPGRDRRLGVHVLEKKRTLALRVKTPTKQIAPLSAEQIRAFLRGLRRYRDIAIVHMMLLCGLRSREVLSLGCRDVCVLERRVRVIGKGDKERIVPLADLASVSVEQYLRHERPRDGADDVLFVCLQGTRRGRAMTPAGLRSLFRNRRHGPDLADANPHRFRHTFGADLARSGLSIAVIQKLMGHENIETTLGYINLSMADITDAFHLASAEIRTRYELGA